MNSKVPPPPMFSLSKPSPSLTPFAPRVTVWVAESLLVQTMLVPTATVRSGRVNCLMLASRLAGTLGSSPPGDVAASGIRAWVADLVCIDGECAGEQAIEGCIDGRYGCASAACEVGESVGYTREAVAALSVVDVD